MNEVKLENLMPQKSPPDAPRQARFIYKAPRSDESAIFSTNRHFSNFGHPQNRSARPVDAGRALDGIKGR
jgi:hypothetical protein